MMDIFVDEETLRRERAKARELRQSQWWKNRIAQGVCHYCGAKVAPKELTLDHIVPLVRGGHSTRGNCVPACKSCNSQKQSLLPIEWAAYLERLGRGGGGDDVR
jgi:5-methylcytosine-specific restriction endonuclease McrA